MSGNPQKLRIEAIQQYLALGYTLIPLSGKIPACPKWTSTIYLDYNETNLPRNYGIVLRPDDLVLDVDPRNGGLPSFAYLIQDIPELNDPESFKVLTGGGGYHLYYKKPENLQTYTHLKNYPGIDFKSSGGQVVGVGSTHPETHKTYSGIVRCPLEAPEALLNMLGKNIKDITPNPVYEILDDEIGIKGYLSHLSTAPASVSGFNGNDNAYIQACRGMDFQLSGQKILECMMQEWNNRCEPEWHPAELKNIIANALAYGINKASSRHPKIILPYIEEKTHIIAPVVNLITTQPTPPAFKINPGGKLYVTCWNIIELLKNPFTYTDRNLGTSILDITQTFIYNELTHEVEFREVPPWKTIRNEWAKRITDFDMVQVKTLLTPFFDKEVPIVVLDEALFGVQSVQQFHPVREILKGLKWDGIPRLDNWLIDYCGVESNAYTKAAGAKTLISLIARVMEPGVKKDEMLLLEGEQGIGKTRLCELLGLDRYFHSCSLDRLDKDFLQNLEGKILIEVSELAGFKNSDMEKVKAMLTRRVDTYRKSYGRKSGDYPRQYIFIGTINPSKDGRYLRDETGNRRFWPVRCEYIKYDEIHEARNQLFAEAIVRWNNGKGETLYLDNVYAQEIHRMGAAERQTCTTTLRNLQEYYEGNLGAEWPVIWHGDVIYDALNMKTSKTTSRALQEINDFFKINRYIRTRRRDATGREKTAYVFMENEDGSDL